MNFLTCDSKDSFCFSKCFFFLSLIVAVLSAHCSFTPEEMAASETQMWKAYYSPHPEAIQSALRRFLNAHYRTHELSEGQVGAYAHTLLAFARTPQTAEPAVYTETVLPLLQSAFDLIHSNSSLFYVSAPLARAELEWWVERRKPNTTVDAVAALMEESFKVLYKGEKPAYSRTCFLRASAAYYRDQAQDKWGGVVDQDWKHIESMLALAYQALPMLNSAQHSLSK
jgi:hypothetical protein